MARPKKLYQCSECLAPSAGWAGQCPSCEAWASIELVTGTARPRINLTESQCQPLQSCLADTTVPYPTTIDEVDRVLGGGLTAGSTILIGGEPGIGKSTLTLQVAMGVAATGATVLVVAGEEAPAQIANRAKRLGSIPASLRVLDEPHSGAVIEAMATYCPQLVVVDSIQTMRADGVEGAPGSVTQLKAATEQLSKAARDAGVSLALVGHITKDGALAGPKAIEHLVDSVLTFGGDRSGELRYLRAVKHRFGPTTEVGLFDMGVSGLTAVPDPSTRFLADRQPGMSGSVVVPVLDGQRPLLVEVQALVVPPPSGTTPVGSPSITTQGVDRKRVDVLAAVLAQPIRQGGSAQQILVSVVGGASMSEPGGDLGTALAIMSSLGGQPIAGELVVCGEVGLGGEVRSVPQLAERLQEAHRLGFHQAIVPASAAQGPTGMELFRVASLAEALACIHGLPSRGRVLHHSGSGRARVASSNRP